MTPGALVAVTVSERVLRAGYVIRKEWVATAGDAGVPMRSAYSPSGAYIGEPRHAAYLARRGIVPELRDGQSSVCSIGYCARERKWYGWSHRAIAGFRVGSRVRKGDVLAPLLGIGFEAETLLDAKRMAELFAEDVG